MGHIAQENLTAETWEKIRAILRPRPPVSEALARAAVWPDRTGRKIKDMSSYHYVNFTTQGKSYNRDRNCPRRNCIIEALRWYQRVIVDERAPLNARRIAIRFVVHLTGDIHQPLHAGHKKDRGGNRIFVEYRGSKVKLHKLWDKSLIDGEELGSPSEIARRLDEGVTADDRQAWQAGPVDRWAVESLSLARSHAYKIPEMGEITDEYIGSALTVIRQRLAQAGVRLSWILNEAFK